MGVILAAFLVGLVEGIHVGLVASHVFLEGLGGGGIERGICVACGFILIIRQYVLV